MASVNKVILVGHLGRDPEVRYLPSGDAIANLSLATTDTWKDKDSGEKKERTEWHRITMFGKLAEIAGEYLKKGSQAYIEGSLTTRKWTDKEGQERYTTEIRCDKLVMLGKANGGERKPDNDEAENARQYREQSGGTARPKPPAGKPGHFDDMEDDIPW